MTEQRRRRVRASSLSYGELDRKYKPLAEVHPFDWACNPAIPEPMSEESEKSEAV